MVAWYEVLPLGAVDSSIYGAVASTDGGYVYAIVGGNVTARIFRSTAGAWWEELTCPISAYMVSIRCSRNGQHVLIWDSTFLYVSHDYGATWVQCAYGVWASRSVAGAAISDDGQKIVASGYSQISGETYRRAYRSISTDGGTTFSSTRSTSIGYGDVGINASGSVVVICGSVNETGADSGLWIYIEGVSNFAKISSLSCKSVSVNLAGDIFYYHVNSGGGSTPKLYKSTDGSAGTMIYEQSVGDGNSVVATDSAGSVVLFGTGSALLYSTNGGTSFAEEKPAGDIATDWSDIVSVSGNGLLLYAMRRPGAESIFETYSSSSQPLPPSQPWTSVSMSNDGQRVVVGTANGDVYVSSDYGATWVKSVLPA